MPMADFLPVNGIRLDLELLKRALETPLSLDAPGTISWPGQLNLEDLRESFRGRLIGLYRLGSTPFILFTKAKCYECPVRVTCSGKGP